MAEKLSYKQQVIQERQGREGGQTDIWDYINDKSNDKER